MQIDKVSNNFVVQLLGRIGAFVIGLIVIGILTRTLGVQGFGEYTTATTFLQLFGVVVDFGLTLTLIVMISEAGANKEKIVGNIFAMRMISGTLLFGLAPILVMTFNWSQDIKQGVLVGTIAYVLMGGATLLIGIFQHFQNMYRAAIAEIINRIVLLLFVAAFAFMDMGVAWMIGASVFANAAWLFAMIKLAHKYIKVRFYFEWNTWKTIISRSWPIAVSIFFNLLYLKGDILFLAYFRNQIEVGYYGVAYKVLDVVTALPVMFMGLLLPVMVKAWTSGDKKSFQEYTNNTFNFFMIAVIPIVVGAQAVSEPLVKLIAGTGYQISSDVLKLLIVALIGVFLGALYGHLIIALNKQKQMTWAYVIVAIFSIAADVSDEVKIPIVDVMIIARIAYSIFLLGKYCGSNFLKDTIRIETIINSNRVVGIEKYVALSKYAGSSAIKISIA